MNTDRPVRQDRQMHASCRKTPAEHCRNIFVDCCHQPSVGDPESSIFPCRISIRTKHVQLAGLESASISMDAADTLNVVIDSRPSILNSFKTLN